MAKPVAEFGPYFLKGTIIDGTVNIAWLNTRDEIKNYCQYMWNGRDYVLDKKVVENVFSVLLKIILHA